MKIKIFSLKEALEHAPIEKTHIIRIYDYGFTPLELLLKNKNYISEKTYKFTDTCSFGWKEFNWVLKNNKINELFEENWKNSTSFLRKAKKEYIENLNAAYTTMEKSFLTPTIAQQIIKDFEEVKNSVDSVVIHCLHGRNRSPAVGIALNEMYDLGYPNLKEQFPFYRRFVLQTMITTYNSTKKQDS